MTTSYPQSHGDPAGHFVAAEVAQLEREGAKATIIAPRAGGAFGWPGVAARVRERPLRALEAGAWVAKATARLVAARPDRIVAHWSVPSAWPIACAPGLRDVPVEVVSHGGDVRLLGAMPLAARERLVTTIARRAESWRFVSDALLHELVGAVGGHAARAVERVASVAPSPLGNMHVDPSDVGARRASLEGRPLYVCAGRLVASKRIDKVIDYVASTARDKDPVLVVLGDGPERPQLERQAQRWRMDVRFLGTMPRPEALSWIGAADELVFASLAEGLSTVVREAEHLGVKVTKLQ
ncbi:MAG: glycosyltransferase [Deltaproteobacteria bacterium]|nr:glycosyltransferase [Deltaproteobacteria bacterium]